MGNGGNTSSGDGIPEETAGPYPGDGSNGPNVLDAATGDALPGHAVDLWHCEVFPSVDAAVGATDRVATSQLAFPEDACTVAYATDGDEGVGNLVRTSLESDNVFGDDGAAEQLATMSGDRSGGFTARLDVPV